MSLERRESALSNTVSSEPAWEQLLPQILFAHKPLTTAMVTDAILSVARAMERGDITQDEADVVLKQVARILIEKQLGSAITKIIPRKNYRVHRGDFTHFLGGSFANG